MIPHPTLFTLETKVAECASIAFVVLGVSLPFAFYSNRSELWLAVKISTGVAAASAVAMIVMNIAMHG